jgi:hypothetical protein
MKPLSTEKMAQNNKEIPCHRIPVIQTPAPDRRLLTEIPTLTIGLAANTMQGSTLQQRN